MKKDTFLYLVFLGLFYFPAITLGQTKINFSEDGKIKSDLPERLKHDDSIEFKIQNQSYKYEDYIDVRNKKIKLAINKLKNQSSKDLLILKNLYKIDLDDIDRLIKRLESALNNNGKQAGQFIPGLAIDSNHIYSYLISDKEYFLTQNKGDLSSTFNINSMINSDDKKLELLLKKSDPFKSAILNWIDKDDYGSNINLSVFHRLKVNADSLVQTAQLILKQDPIKSNDVERLCCEEIMKLIISIDEAIKNENFSSKTDWIKKWIWYTGGVPKLNPFTFSKIETVEPDTSELPTLRISIATIDAALKKADSPALYSKAESMISARQVIEEKLLQTERAFKSYQKKLEANEQSKKDFSTTAAILNSTIFYVSLEESKKPEDGSITWMIHHDISNDNEPINANEISGYIESDREVVLGHNFVSGEKITKGQKFIDVSEDRPGWEESPIEIISSLNKLKSTLASSLFSFTKSQPSTCNLKDAIANLNEKIILLNYILQQSNPDLDLKARTEKEPVFHSEVITTVRRVKGPKIFQYWIKSSKASETQPADTFQYRVNKLYRILPFAGVAFGTKQFDNITINSTQSAPELLEHKYVIKAFIGLKVYPFRKIDIQSGRFIARKDERQNYLFSSRFNLQFGVSIPTPLENLYGGIGIDLYPGVNLSGGIMFNKYTSYGFRDGKLNLKVNQYRTGGYVGISTDLTLFNDILKLVGL